MYSDRSIGCSNHRPTYTRKLRVTCVTLLFASQRRVELQFIHHCIAILKSCSYSRRICIQDIAADFFETGNHLPKLHGVVTQTTILIFITFKICKDVMNMSPNLAWNRPVCMLITIITPGESLKLCLQTFSKHVHIGLIALLIITTKVQNPTCYLQNTCHWSSTIAEGYGIRNLKEVGHCYRVLLTYLSSFSTGLEYIPCPRSGVEKWNP
jgi:hypothetical protein